MIEFLQIWVVGILLAIPTLAVGVVFWVILFNILEWYLDRKLNGD